MPFAAICSCAVADLQLPRIQLKLFSKSDVAFLVAGRSIFQYGCSYNARLSKPILSLVPAKNAIGRIILG